MASISLLLLMDLVLNADMDFTQSIALPARPVNLIVLIVLIALYALIVLQDLVLMVLAIVGHVMFLTVIYADLQISVLLVSILIRLIISQIPVLVCILLSYCQIILATVLLEEVTYLGIAAGVAMLIAPSVIKIQEFAQNVIKAIELVIKYVFNSVQL